MKQKLLNKLWLRVGMIVAIMTTALSGTVWAETVTFSPSTDKGSVTTNGTTTTGDHVTKDGITITSSNGCMGTGQYRVYTGGTLTIESSVGKISKIVFTFSGTYSALSGTGYSNGTWQGTAASNVSLSSTAQSRITGVTVTYTSTGSSAVATTTTINATGITNTDFYTSTAAGSLSASVTEKVSGNAVSGATVTWTSSDENVATIAADGAVTLVAAGSVIFTASYEGETGTYQPSSATYEMTVTSSAPYVQPTTVEIIPNYTFWGQTAQFSGSTYSNLSGSQDNVSLAWSRGTGSTYANTTAMRFYKDNTLTFTAPTGYEIKSIVLAVSGTYSDLTFSPSGYDSENTTWSGSSSTVTMSRPSNGSSYATISKFTITIGQASTDPSISADNVEIAYNATEGSIAFTVTNPVDGGQVSATTEANWLTSGSATSTSPISFTCSANSETTARTATVTLTYTYNSSETVTTTVTVTQAAAPVIYTTIPALFDAATSTESEVLVTFDNWVVSGVSTNGKNVFVTDNAGNGFVIYSSSDQSSTYAVGNILSGTAVTCGLKKYNGFAELLNVDASDLTITTGGTVTAANVAMADLAGVNTGALVSYENLTCSVDNSKYYLTDGTTTLQVFNSLYAFDELEDGKTYNITGIYEQFNSTKEILPRSAADIEEYVAPKHTVTFFVNGVEQTDDEAEVSEGAAITFPATPADVNGKTFMGWTTEEISGTTDTAPTIVTSATMGNADVTYYAVFATSTSGGASDTYSLVSDVNDLSDGDNIILVSTGSYTASGQTHYFTVANGNVNSSSLMDPVDVTITDDQVTSTDVAPITLKEVTGGWKLQMGTEYINIVSTKNQITLDENGAVNTISITSGDATIGTADGSDTRNIYYNPNSGNGRFAYYKSAQKPVSIYKQEGGVTYSGYCTTVAPATESVTLNAYGYATYCSQNALDFTGNSDVTAWVITAANSTTGVITFSQIEGKVPAGTGMLLKGSASTPVNITSATGTVAAPSPNLLEGTLASKEVEEDQYYGLSGNEFVKVNAGIVPAGKALLPASVLGGNVKAFTFVFEDDATGIEETLSNSPLKGENIYNLAGQMVNGKSVNGKLPKGIYIVNGKKILK